MPSAAPVRATPRPLVVREPRLALADGNQHPQTVTSFNQLPAQGILPHRAQLCPEIGIPDTPKSHACYTEQVQAVGWSPLGGRKLRRGEESPNSAGQCAG